MEFLQGEDRHFDGDLPGFPIEAGSEAHIRKFFAHNSANGEMDHGNPRYFADVGYRPGGAGIDFDHIDFVIGDDELDIDHAQDI